MNNSREITISTYKYDGTPHRSWKGDLVKHDDNLLVLVGVFEREISHPDLGIIKPQTISYEYYWLDRWYNVFRFHEPNGELRNFYCNIGMPPKFENDVLEYVDLDVDILVSPEFEFEVLDREEFKLNATRYGYPKYVVTKARLALKELGEMIRLRTFPFSQK